ncbi:LysR substrate-binding domain-containing protein [Microtetraspora malaysiensis]|uniref:LysR substrate-binding domain-containing protein n=1 Tax=Microtetraspora malaysiensis TaxID=161358 RepID=UPI003D8CDB1A
MVKLAREALDTVREIEMLAAGEQAPGAELRIAATPSLEPGLAGRLLPAYAAEHPGIRVQIVRCDGRDSVVTAVREQRADLGLTDLPVPTDLVTHPGKPPGAGSSTTSSRRTASAPAPRTCEEGQAQLALQIPDRAGQCGLREKLGQTGPAIPEHRRDHLG